MKFLNKLHYIQISDFKERTRSYSFLILLGIVTFLSYFIIPPLDQEGKAVRLVIGNGYRAIYNSTFIGNAVVMFVVLILSLFGFYFINNSIQRDYQTGVGQIIVTTPTKKVTYLLGKLFSNFLVLAIMIGLIFIVALILNILRAEVPIDLWQLFAPFLFIALPTMFFISSISVLFETVPFLRGTFGNIIYFFVWTTLLALDASFNLDKVNELSGKFFDIFGLKIIKTIGNVSSNVDGISWNYCDEKILKPILWESVDWELSFVKERIMWIIVSIGIVMLSSIVFSYFDSSKQKKKINKVKINNKANNDKLVEQKNNNSTFLSAKDLTIVPMKFRFFSMVKAEKHLMFKSLPWWWILIVVGLNIACIFAPLDIVEKGLFPIAWLFPIGIWSSMGSKERKFNTEQLVFSAKNCAERQIPAMFIAGTFLSILTGSGMALRLIIAANFKGLISFIVYSMFISSLALILGVISENKKLFEVLYIIIWYFGPINHIEVLNFAGVLDRSFCIEKLAIYCLATIIFFCLSLSIRKAKLHNR